jgi:hypothetical protein
VANEANNSNKADEANVADVDAATTETIGADKADVANKPNEANKAKADEANGAILTNKAVEAIKVDDTSLTKYSAILLKEKMYILKSFAIATINWGWIWLLWL